MKAHWLFRALSVTSGLVLLLAGAACSDKPKAATKVPSPLVYQHIVRRDPEFSIHVVTVNLDDPRVEVHVARGGPDPDGDGPWLTTLMPTTEIAEREHFDVAINGDFFTAKATEDIEGRNTGYVKGKFASPVGTAMTDGTLWHRSKTTRPWLEITSASTARFAVGAPTDPIDKSVRQIISGSQIIVRNRLPVVYTTKFATDRHPRTAVGIARDGKQLILFVVDGRQPQLSMGMTLAEVAKEMILLGCEQALNLDGGGSTTLVYRDPDRKKLEVLNSPSDMTERSVADVLGVTVKKTPSAAK
jgi:exopolysaccharide biosynthesis protein